MGWTKADLIADAWAVNGIANYEFDLSGGQIDNALRILDNMMSEWNGKGIKIGFPLSLSPSDSNTTDDTSIPDFAYTAIIYNLAIRLGPTIGKQALPEVKQTAKTAYETLTIICNTPRTRQMPANYPAGAGNRQTRDAVFLEPPEDTKQLGDDSYKIG